MNVSQFLNANAYPGAGRNARVKYLPKESEVAIVAGTEDYLFFNAALTNPLVSNLRLPISGSEIYYVDRIRLLCNIPDTITATIFAELMQSYLEVTVNDRIQYKTSVASILNFGWQALGVTAAQVDSSGLRKVFKQFNNSILINSSSNVQFRLHLNAAAATALDDLDMTLELNVLQFDKLQTGEFDPLGVNRFQKIDFDFYEIQAVTVGAAATYNFFQNTGQSTELYSKLLPMSESEAFQVQSIQLLFSDQNTVAPDYSLWYPRMKNRLTIEVDQVKYYDGMIGDALSFYGKYVTAAEDNGLILMQESILKTPIIFPAKGNISVTMQQGAEATPAAGFVMCRLQGEMNRIVA